MAIDDLPGAAKPQYGRLVSLCANSEGKFSGRLANRAPNLIPMNRHRSPPPLVYRPSSLVASHRRHERIPTGMAESRRQPPQTWPLTWQTNRATRMRSPTSTTLQYPTRQCS